MHGTGRVNKKLYNLKNFHLKGKLREKKAFALKCIKRQLISDIALPSHLPSFPYI